MADEVRVKTEPPSEDTCAVKSELDIGDTVLQPADARFKFLEPKREPADEPLCDKYDPDAPEGPHRHSAELHSGGEAPGASSTEYYLKIESTGDSLLKYEKEPSSGKNVVRAEIESSTSGKYICGICNKSLRFKNQLNRHFATHRQYRCNICYKFFECKKKLTEHKIIAHRTLHQCEQCALSFRDVCGLKSHILTHIDKVYECNICRYPFGARSSLIQHKAAGLCGSDLYKCDICDKLFQSPSALDAHKRVMHSLYFECKVCNASFKSTENLIQHERDHHPNTRMYKCDFCCCSYNKNGTLYSHMQASHRNMPLFQCDNCDQSFKLKETLARHIIRNHACLQLHNCEFCHKSFDTKLLLYQHNTLFNCSNGSDKCKNSSKLKIEPTFVDRKTNHDTPRLHKCDVCDESFKFKIVLDQHKLVKHTAV